MKCELGHILTYYDGSQPQFAHLRASMLAYAHINLLSMLSRFEPDEAVRVATDSIYVKKTARGGRGLQASWGTPKRVLPHLSHLPQQGSPEATTRWDWCRWNTQPTSLSLTTSVLKRTSLPQPRRATTIPWPDTAELPKRRRGSGKNHASDRALPYQKPPRLHPDPSPGQRNAGQGRPGPELSQLLPLERPNRLDAREDGTEIRSPCDHLGRGLHSAPPNSGNLPRLARGSGRPGHLLWRPGAAAPNRRRNATRLAPRALFADKRLLRRGRGRPQSQRPPS